MLPVMLSVRGRRCLVVGGGGVALRKALALVAEQALVTVVAPVAVSDLESLAALGRIDLERRPYAADEARGYSLVFAATDDPRVNRQVFEDAEAAGVWANVADDPELCSFQVPARVSRGALNLAIASDGGAPFVSRRLRRLFESRLGMEWAEWADAAQRFRRLVKELGLDATAQEALYDRFFSETVDAERLAVEVPTSEEMRAWLPAGGDGALPHRTRRADPPSPGAARPASRGFVSLVGAGPGCAGLLTVRAIDRLHRADALVYDRLAEPAIPSDLPAHVELHCVGKTAGNHPVRQEEINATLVRLGQEGKRVVRLKGGDPYVFGRGGEEAEALDEAGVPYEVVPGVTSGIAGPSFAGIPVTHRREAVRVTLVTAHEAVKRDGPQVRWDLLAQDPSGTIVGYMGVTAVGRTCAELLAYGMDPATPAAMIERGTTSAQKTLVSTVANLAEDAEKAGIGPPALFVIGRTIAHAARLDWRGRLPLARSRIAVPSSAMAAVRALEDAGADVVPTPIPVTPAARIVLNALPLSGCLLRTPADVDAFDEERGGAGFGDAAVAWCVGSAAATRARERGWRVVREVAHEADVAGIAAAGAGDSAEGGES